MNAVGKAAVLGGVTLAVATAIAVNHDHTYLGGRHSSADSIGAMQREHVLGWITGAGVAGAGVAALKFGHRAAGGQLLAVAGAIIGGTMLGHAAWDRWLDHEGVTDVAPDGNRSLRDDPIGT
jgi:hypothetical protein